MEDGPVQYEGVWLTWHTHLCQSLKTTALTVRFALNAVPWYPSVLFFTTLFNNNVREVMVEWRYQEKTPITRRKLVPVPLCLPNLSQCHSVYQTCPSATLSTKPVPVPLCLPNLSQCHSVYQTCPSASLPNVP
jgi:hypothetical protein